MKINALGQFVKVPLKDRFWVKVNKNGPLHPYNPALGRCWMWTGARLKRKHDYGLIWDDTHTKRLRAHRIAWILLKGPIPKGKGLLHSCDNCPCVNPEHTRPGDASDNHRDMISHGRALNGEHNPMARLTEKQVRYILSKYPIALRTGPRDPSEKVVILRLCKKFHVSMSYLARLASGERWSHINC
jgi:hypothetical protein